MPRTNPFGPELGPCAATRTSHTDHGGAATKDFTPLMPQTHATLDQRQARWAPRGLGRRRPGARALDATRAPRARYTTLTSAYTPPATALTQTLSSA